MRYRFHTLSSPDRVVTGKTARSTPPYVAVEANALRAKATRYRQLAETFYDERLICELERYASELESKAKMLDAWKRPLYRVTVN